jgi:beta-glucanase (GH16 family)
MSIILKIIFAACLVALILASCASSGIKGLSPIQSPKVFTIKAPAAGNYPQGLYKYPYKAGAMEEELFTQTIEWSPQVKKTFNTNTQYTAILTLVPVNRQRTFEGTILADIIGLPTDGVDNITLENNGRNLAIRIAFNATAGENAAAQLVFSDDFEGTSLDTGKWETCPEWDRQGRSTWKDDMVSVSDGLLHLKFRRDPELGKEKSRVKKLADNWIRAGAVRTRKQEWPWDMLFENTFGYYEARIKFPVVSGTWGAFWLMSPTQWILSDEGKDGTEIDIIESIDNHKGRYNAALNWNGYGSQHKSAGNRSDDVLPVNIYDGEFHIIALDWSPSEYVFYVDGRVFWRADGGAQSKNSGINQNPIYIKLTVESASDSSGNSWAGDIPSDFSEAEMLVDYVRVYNQPVLK